jgi:hypothetical protein
VVLLWKVARNKELVMKYEQQTWQQKQFGLEANDLREQLFDSNLGKKYTLILMWVSIFALCCVQEINEIRVEQHGSHRLPNAIKMSGKWC